MAEMTKKFCRRLQTTKSRFAYLGDLCRCLQSKDADDLSKPADLDQDEGVAQSTGGRRQTAKQQVPVTVIAEVWQT